MQHSSQVQKVQNKLFSPVVTAAVLSLVMAGCTSTQNTVDSGGYKDGTYSATGNYTSPAGAEEVAITITLKDDVITAAEFDGKATHPTSRKMQDKFDAGFQEVVVGKAIDGLSLTVVNGSSLAPKGFMSALEKVKAEANA